MTRQMYTIDHVFGISRDLPLNYVARHSADDELVANLTRDKHVVIYGSSKQGKTCLRKHCLKEEDYITVQCSNKWTIAELHSNILKRAGYEIELSNKKSITGKNKINASLGVKTPLLSAKIGGEGGTEESSEVEKKELELDPEDANDIIGALQEIGFSKYIVLEDFHYLTQECQRDFAIALKAFHEKSTLCFLIVGVWLEENRLVVYNGDLTGRIVAINASYKRRAGRSAFRVASQRPLTLQGRSARTWMLDPSSLPSSTSKMLGISHLSPNSQRAFSKLA